MASAEVPRSESMGRRTFLKRYFVMPAVRGGTAYALTTPLMRAATAAGDKIESASAAAKSTFPDPTPPTTSPELRAVANRENDLLAQRKAVDETTVHIQRSRGPQDTSDTLRRALEDDKNARIDAIDDQRIQLRESPEYKAALAGYNRDQQAYRQAVIDTGTSRANEQSRLEEEAGVNVFERMAYAIGGRLTVGLFQVYSVLGAAAIPFYFKRGAWPLREKAQTPPQTPDNAESNPE